MCAPAVYCSRLRCTRSTIEGVRRLRANLGARGGRRRRRRRRRACGELEWVVPLEPSLPRRVSPADECEFRLMWDRGGVQECAGERGRWSCGTSRACGYVVAGEGCYRGVCIYRVSRE